MLLTITTTHRPATDLGFLLHKHPDRVQSFDLSFGKAHVFYPEASEEICTAALLLDVDPVALARGHRGPSGEGGLFERYVNDRPYVASSFLSVAIARVLGSALHGRCSDRPELVTRPLPLEARLEVIPSRGGPGLLEGLFAPLGYEVEATRHTLDARFPEWGDGAYHSVTLRAETRLADLLSHLYVLVPVLDDEKHYWVSDQEIDKLLAHGEGWLRDHPMRGLITRRYLRHQGRYVRRALARLVEEEDPTLETVDGSRESGELVLERPLSLNEQRHASVVEEVTRCGATSVGDLGCGEGRLLRRLLKQRALSRIVGIDVSVRALEIAARRLRLERLPERQRRRISLRQGSLLYVDAELAELDAVTVIEVIEHLDPFRRRAFERVVFEKAAPETVILTTPNREYNVRWETLPAGRLRHPDHRFEWTRDEFRGWAEAVASSHGYAVRFEPIGPVDPEVGPPTQMAVFRREGDGR